MNFRSNITVIENLIERFQSKILSEIKLHVIFEDDGNKQNDTDQIENIMGLKGNPNTIDKTNNKDNNIDNKNQENEPTNDNIQQTTNDSKKQNDFEVKLKWLSKQYDEMYNNLYNLAKSKPSISQVFSNFTELYSLLEFFLQNIKKYEDEEKSRIYVNFNLALKKINTEIKKLV